MTSVLVNSDHTQAWTRYLAASVNAFSAQPTGLAIQPTNLAKYHDNNDNNNYKYKILWQVMG